MKINSFIIFLIVIFSLPSIASLFQPGFFQSDDGEWMIIRFSAFHQALSDGQFPVRWLGRLNHEYGYPVANFLYPGFMYMAEIPKMLGFGFVDSIKIILGVSMVASATFTYLWLLKIFGRFPAFAGALFYLYAPYHLFDFYSRGSVGEILALAVAPFVFWQIERKSFFWTSIGIAFLILSHNTLAVLFLGLITAYMGLKLYIQKKRNALLRTYVQSLIAGLGLSSFFWIPAIFDLKYTVFFETSVSDWSNYFADLSLIGFSTLTILVFGLMLFLVGKLELGKHRLTILFFVVSVISLFFASSASSQLWNILPVSFIQFPFRFLSLTILGAAFLLASALSVLPRKVKIIAAFIIISLTLLSSKSFMAPVEHFDKGEGFYATNMDTTTVRNEYMPRWVRDVPTGRSKEKLAILDGKIYDMSIKTNKISFVKEDKEKARVRVNTVYFPGWKAEANGKNLSIGYNNEKGIMELDLPEGISNVNVYFSETPVRFFANIVSFTSVILLLGIVWRQRHVY